MPTLYQDMVQGTRLTQTPEGYSATRVMIVAGLTSVGPQRLKQALEFVGASLGNRGVFHPTIPGLFFSRAEVEPQQGDGSIARVTIYYEQITATRLPANQAQPGEISIGATVQEVETNIDADGYPLIVSYKPNTTTTTIVNIQLNPRMSFVVDPNDQNAKVIVAKGKTQAPNMLFTLTRREAQDPSINAKIYLGKVNATPFRGDGPGIWMCSRLDGPTDDGGISWKVNYEFQRNPSNWMLSLYVYNDPTTGVPPIDIDPVPVGNLFLGQTGNGWAVYNHFKTADFNALNLV